jgi:hypothetical protein
MPSGADMSLGRFSLLILSVLFIQTGLEQRYGLHFDMDTWNYWIGNALIWMGIYVLIEWVFRK